MSVTESVAAHGKNVGAKARSSVESGFAFGDAYEGHRERELAAREERQRANGVDERFIKAAQIQGQLVTFVVVGLVILIGILIYSEVEQALPIGSGSDFENQTDLENAAHNSTETFGESMELAPLVILVGVAGLLLAVVQRFR